MRFLGPGAEKMRFFGPEQNCFFVFLCASNHFFDVKIGFDFAKHSRPKQIAKNILRKRQTNIRRHVGVITAKSQNTIGNKLNGHE